MRLSLFDSFADMIVSLPARAITRTLDREQRMLREDLFCQRPVPLDEAESILNFCRYIDAVREESSVKFSAPLPSEHLEFYRNTLGRLIDAGELPFEAQVGFDRVLSSDSHSPMSRHFAA